MAYNIYTNSFEYKEPSRRKPLDKESDKAKTSVPQADSQSSKAGQQKHA